MIGWPHLLLLLPAAVLAWDDFRTRKVNVAWLVTLGCATLMATGMTVGIRVIVSHTTVNTILLLLTGGATAVYLRLRKLPLRTSFGAGDSIMLLALTPLYTPEGYIRFLLVSCILALIWWSMARSKTIPLAGIMAVALAGYVLYKIIMP